MLPAFAASFSTLSRLIARRATLINRAREIPFSPRDFPRLMTVNNRDYYNYSINGISLLAGALIQRATFTNLLAIFTSE